MELAAVGLLCHRDRAYARELFAQRSFSVSTGRTPENFCGALGAWTADLMLSAFGFSAWWFVLGSAMIGFFAIRTAWRRMKGETDPLRINPPKITAAVGFLAVLVGSTCLEALRSR